MVAKTYWHLMASAHDASGEQCAEHTDTAEPQEEGEAQEEEETAPEPGSTLDYHRFFFFKNAFIIIPKLFLTCE